MSTYLADIMTVVGKMKPTPPNFIYEEKDWANIMIDGIHNGLPVICFYHNYDFRLGGKYEDQETQNFMIEFLYKTDFQASELLKNAAIMEKCKVMADQFWKLFINEHKWEITEQEEAVGIMVNENRYDGNYIGVGLQISGKKQAGTCYSDIWTGSLVVTPTPLS